MGTGTILDATITGAVISINSADKARDPQMYQTRKGQQSYFGMKMRIGVYSWIGLPYSSTSD